MIKISHRLTALAVQTSHGQIDFLECVEDFLNLACLNESRQVHHDADTDSCADVGRAGGQVAVLIVKGERDLFFDGVVNFVHRLPAVVQREAAAEDLHA